ncbi:hypothetical protein ACFL4T_14615, partial [candidate division KSB1 bacterium]
MASELLIGFVILLSIILLIDLMTFRGLIRLTGGKLKKTLKRIIYSGFWLITAIAFISLIVILFSEEINEGENRTLNFAVTFLTIFYLPKLF